MLKPFVKRPNGRACAFVPVKTEEQQANAILFRARDLLVRQRTQCINALRGHLLEYGYVSPQGVTHVATLVAHVEDPGSALPENARLILKLLIDTFTALEGQIAQLDGEINRRSKADPTARRLMTIPGVGPIISTAITALAPAPQNFPGGRAFAAWLGLTPRGADLYQGRGGALRTAGVRVNSVHPGYMPPMLNATNAGERADKIEATPLRRLGEPIEVAYGVLFLASDEASFITGTELVINGGYIAQ
jgi:transposase